MSEVKVNKISPRSGTTVTLGDSGDTFTLASGVSLTGVNATFSGDLTVDTDTFKVDSTNNLVGVGGTSTVGGGETNGQILFSIPTGNRALTIKTVSDGAEFDVGTTNTNLGKDLIFSSGGSEVARFTSSGLAIGGTGSANALDDYETGTFTPTLEDTSTNAATGSFLGRYTKVGNRVTLDIRLVNIDTTGLTAGSKVLIKGLPFAAQTSDAQVYSIGSVMSDSFTFSGYIVSELQGNSSDMELKDCSTGTGDAFIIVSDITSGTSDLLITHTYETD